MRLSWSSFGDFHLDGFTLSKRIEGRILLWDGEKQHGDISYSLNSFSFTQ